MNTFFGDWKLATLGDLDGDNWLVSRSLLYVLDFLDDFVALEDFSEDNVSAIEMGRSGSGNEELRSVGILSGVGHRHKTLLGVLQLEVLIGKLVTVDGLSTSAITICEVTTLNHEVLDDTVEARTLISITFLSSSQSAEVLGGFWDSLSIEPNHNTTHLLISMLDIEVDLVGDFGAFHSFGGLGEEDEGEGED